MILTEKDIIANIEWVFNAAPVKILKKNTENPDKF